MLRMAWYKIFSSPEETKERLADRSTLLVKIKGKEIFLARIGDEYYAADNDCPHQGYPLNEGTINYLREIVCPWHAYRFSLKTGKEAEMKCGYLQTYELKFNDEGLFINIEI